MGVFDLPSGGEIELLPVHEDFPACDRVTNLLRLWNVGTMSKTPAQQISSPLLTRRSQGLLKICNKLLLVGSLSRLNIHPPTLGQSSSRSGWFIFQPQTLVPTLSRSSALPARYFKYERNPYLIFVTDTTDMS